jgi:hypothetical protein
MITKFDECAFQADRCVSLAFCLERLLEPASNWAWDDKDFHEATSVLAATIRRELKSLDDMLVSLTPSSFEEAEEAQS